MKLSDCQRSRWYHVSIVGETDSTDLKVSITPHLNPKKFGWRSIGKLQPYQDVKLPKPLSQPTDISFRSIAESKATGAWNIDNVCIAGDITAPRQRYWSFVPDLSEANSKKKVFAYYYPCFGAPGHFEDPTLSWTFWSWMNLNKGLDSRRRDAGSKMQFIALPRVPIMGLDDKKKAQEIEMAEEVKLGMMMGMDGFVTDFNHNEKGGWNWFNMKSRYIMDAAAKTDGKFKVVPAIYALSSTDSAVDESTEGVGAKRYALNQITLNAIKHPAVYKNEQGKPLLSMWLTERYSTKWWTDVLDELKKQDVPVALFTQFNTTSHIKEFSDLAYGMSHWGPRHPGEYAWYELARPYTKLLGYPICAQDVRTRGAHIIAESQNSRTIRKLWMDAITKDADWTVIDTWSDYSEQAQMPSTAIGYVLYDLHAYYGHWFKTGKQPEIVRDVLYYCHRRQHTDATQLHGVRWSFGHSEPQNEIELLAFLKEPGTLVVNVDGEIHRQKADAGITSFMVPLPKEKRFVPYFAVERDGKETLGGKGRYTIYDKVDFPNLLYHYGVIVK